MDMLKHRETARVLSKCRCLHLFVFVLFVSAVPLSLDGCFVRVLCLRSCCVCVFGILFIMHWCFSHFVEFLFASFRKHIYIILNTHFHFMIHSVGPFKQQEAIPSIAPLTPWCLPTWCVAQSSLLKRMWPLLERASTPTTQRSSRV